MNVAAGLSKAFVEGGKDLIALVKYLGDKELAEKKLGMEQERLGLERERVRNTSEYQSGLLQNMMKRDEFAREKFDYEKGLKERELNLRDKKTQAEIRLLNSKIDAFKAQKKAAEKSLYQDINSLNLKELKTKMGLYQNLFNMSKDILSSMITSQAKRLKIPTDQITELERSINSGNLSAIEKFRESYYETFDKKTRKKFDYYFDELVKWYDTASKIGTRIRELEKQGVNTDGITPSSTTQTGASTGTTQWRSLLNKPQE